MRGWSLTIVIIGSCLVCSMVYFGLFGFDPETLQIQIRYSARLSFLIFALDKNLGAWIKKETGRDMLLWDGACIVHEAFSIDKLITTHQKNPKAAIIAHPESEDHILKAAEYVGSTSGMINYVKTNPSKEFIVATEAGILYEMQKEVPGKELIPAPSKEDNTCACSECHYMKMNTMQKLYLCMKYELPEVTVPEEIRLKALKPIQKMLDISANK